MPPKTQNKNKLFISVCVWRSCGDRFLPERRSVSIKYKTHCTSLMVVSLCRLKMQFVKFEKTKK